MLATMTLRPGAWMRSSDAPTLLESFFIAAVASFLGIRAFLAVTGYPRIGSGGIHIAHMLWGGLLMLAALMLLLAFLDRSVEHLAAVVAGLGFGTFIDEIGKFVTADNDYFFRPSVALIYVLMVATFLVSRTLIGGRRLGPKEALANVLHQLAEAADRPIEPSDRARIKALLAQADHDSELTRLIDGYVDRRPATSEIESPIEILRRRLDEDYEKLMANEWAERALVVFVIAYAASAVIGAFLIAPPSGAIGAQEPSTVAAIAHRISSVVGAVLVARGVISLRAGSRASAYRWFMRGLLVWILVTQVFVFYSSQLAGLGGLVIDLIAYGSLRFALAHELAAGH
jgi:hypothetical protein